MDQESLVGSEVGLKHRRAKHIATTISSAASADSPSKDQPRTKGEGSGYHLINPIRNLWDKVSLRFRSSSSTDNMMTRDEESLASQTQQKRTKACWRAVLVTVSVLSCGVFLFWLDTHIQDLIQRETPMMMPDMHPLRSVSKQNQTTSKGRIRTLQTDNEDALYRDLEDEPNPSWEDLKATLPVGENSKGPAYGSTVKISRSLIEIGDFAERPIMQEVKVHVPINSYIGRPTFPNITRWYQEDFHTQVFRMFKGDDNIRNNRARAPRSEAFTMDGWKRGEGWHQWSGRYTFLKVRNGAVFQLKHNTVYWSMQLCLRATRDGTFNLIYQTLFDYTGATILEEDVRGKSFDVIVQDDGTNHKVYIDGSLRIHNIFTNRTDNEKNKPRWGFYSPGSAIDREILILVTGAKVEKLDDSYNCNPLTLVRDAIEGAKNWFQYLFGGN